MTTTTAAYLLTILDRMRPMVATLALACLLSACAMAPGMRMDADSQYGNAKEDAAPPGTLTPITPTLIAEQRKASPKGVSKDIKRSEEHTSELQSLMRISYAVFCLKKKKNKKNTTNK